MKIELISAEKNLVKVSYTPNWLEKIFGEKYYEKEYFLFTDKEYLDYKSRRPLVDIETGKILGYDRKEVVLANDHLFKEEIKKRINEAT